MSYPIQYREAWEQPGYRIADGDPPGATLSQIDTTVIHWTGYAFDDSSPAAIAAGLRSMQSDWLRNRSYSLGYLWLVDPVGVAWEIRGFDYKSAANSGHNDHTATILVTVSGSEPVSETAWQTIRELSADYKARSAQTYLTRPVAHSDLSGAATACPGDTVRAQIAAGHGDIDHPSQEGLDMFIFRSGYYRDQFAVGGGAVHLSPGMLEFLEARGVPVFLNDDPDAMRYVCLAAGFPHEDLTPID